MPNNRAIAYLAVEDESKAAFASFRSSMQDTEALAGRLKGVLAGVFSVAAITQSVRAVVDAAREAEQSEARLAATLRATGLSAGLTTKELEAMNAELVELTQFDDEGIRNAQATLLKFGNIQGEVFDRALKSAADLAAFIGTDLPSAAQLVGKALQSPTEGVGALERNIGKLSGAQERVIKDLVESGRLYDAQGEVLKVLQDRIGGTAQALNTGLTKATSDVSKAWGDFLEELGRTDGIGGVVTGVLGGVTASLVAMRKELQGIRTPISEALDEFARLGKGLPGGGLATVMDAYITASGARGAAREGPSVSGRIKGVLTPEEEAARAAAERARKAAADEAEAALGDRNAATLAKLREQEAKRAAEERLAREKRLQEEGVRGWVAYADAVFSEADRLNTELAQIAVERSRREEEERVRAEQQLVESIERQMELEREAGLASNKGRSGLQEIEEQTRRNADVARELGLTFQSAFEDAVIAGEGLRGVLRGIAEDLSRLVLRKGVTEPAAGFVTRLLGDFDLGKLFSGFFAEGGFIQPGTFGVVGERGPELAFGGRLGKTIVPSGGAGAVTIYQDNRGADAAAIARLNRRMEELYRTVPRLAVDAVQNARGRGMEV